MAKKATATTAPKTKATPKAAQVDAGAKKPQKSAPKKAKAAKKIKVPAWLLPYPVDYVVGTQPYGRLIKAHNELFGTAWNQHRVQPQVFYTIHQGVWNHYDPAQYQKHLTNDKG